LRFTFAAGSLGVYVSLQKSPRFADCLSGKLESLQCGPPAPAGGGPAKIRRSPAAGSAGDGRGVMLGCPRPDFGLGLAGDSAGRVARWRRLRRALRSLLRRGCGRGNGLGGSGSFGRARGDVGMVAQPRELAGTRLGGGGHGGRQRRGQVAVGGSAREARGGSTFIGDAREPC
jgi:hypothetical protein